MKYQVFLRRLLLAFLGILIGLGVYFANASRFFGNDLPMPFGFGATVVLSGSMEPTYSQGDLLFVKEAKEIAVGDFVVYRSEGLRVTHRVVKIDGDTIITQGDANNVPDKPFERDAVEAVVIGYIPFVGNLVEFIKRPMGICLILTAAILLIELSFKKQKNHDDKELDTIRAEIESLKQDHHNDV